MKTFLNIGLMYKMPFCSCAIQLSLYLQRIFYISVEKVTLLCQFLSVDIIRDSSLAKSTLVHGFVYLVSAIDDVHSAVAARARTMVMSINKKSLKVSMFCACASGVSQPIM